MVEQKTPVSPEIPKLLAVVVGLVPFASCLGEGHGLGGFAGNTDMVKVDGMVQLIFDGDHDDGVSRNLFVDGDVDTQKKPEKEQDDGNDNKDFTFFSGFHGVEGSLFLQLKNTASYMATG